MSLIKFPFVIISALIFLVVVGMFISVDAPWAKNEMEQQVKENCAACEVVIGRAVISWRGLILHNTQFTVGEAGAQRLEVKIHRMVIRPEILPLFKKQVHVESVVVFEPDVIFSEGEDPEKNEPSGADDEKTEKFKVEQIAVYGGKFTYVRDVKGTHAILKISKIIGRINFSEENADARFTAQMGESGEFDLFVSIRLKKPLHVDTELNVREQNLEDLSVFLKPNAGVELKGILVKAHSQTKLRDTKLAAAVTVTFKDFKVQLHEMYDRSEWQAFFTSLGASLALKKENLEDSAQEKSRSVQIDREAHESIVHFNIARPQRSGSRRRQIKWSADCLSDR